ncbi:Sec-independent protein translocase subunit TatA/TatB [Paratractidigestivibacter sp.]|uniref:Sec-independent protein translocase subunit TatA/TatB n=1 Tax=Paratractidigestivibacter sp. TaxID=2847316 RepID=UPI003AB7C707
MFGIGETELVLILLFAFMIFGPDKLPGMGKTLGRALRQFRNAQEGFTQVVQTEIVDPATEAMSDNPKKPNRKRVEFDEDADIEGGEEGAAAKRTETFAERKKRLEAERKAREAAEKQAAEKQAAAASDEVADADTPAAEAAKKDEPAEEAPKKPSVADLYSMKRPAAEPEPAAENADAEAAPSEPDTQKEA